MVFQPFFLTEKCLFSLVLLKDVLLFSATLSCGYFQDTGIFQVLRWFFVFLRANMFYRVLYFLSKPVEFFILMPFVKSFILILSSGSSVVLSELGEIGFF